MGQVIKEKSDITIVRDRRTTHAASDEQWNKKIEKALAARQAGRELRKGKAPGLSTVQRTRL